MLVNRQRLLAFTFNRERLLADGRSYGTYWRLFLTADGDCYHVFIKDCGVYRDGGYLKVSEATLEEALSRIEAVCRFLRNTITYASS